MKKMMRKWALLITVVVAVTGCAVAATLAAQTTDFVLMINGKVVETEKPIVAIDNSSYLPVRELSEKLGFDVTWHEQFGGQKKVVDIQTNSKNVIHDWIKETMKLDLPENTRALDYTYYGEEGAFWGEVSISHEEIDAVIEQLEKEYVKGTQAGQEGEKVLTKEEIFQKLSPIEPLLEEQRYGWKLNHEQVEYAYYKPQGETFIFVLKEADGQHVVYLMHSVDSIIVRK